jgi:predicted nucleic acid-binding protein
VVIDASAFTEIVLGGKKSSAIAAHAEADGHCIAPEHFTVEVASALRSAWLRGVLDDGRFAAAVQRLADAAIETWPVRPLLHRLLELSPNVSAYDSAYIALAEHVDVPLLTAHRRLCQVPGIRCRFLLGG